MGLENKLVDAALKQWMVLAEIDQCEFVNSNDYPRMWEHYQFALRCNIACILTAESFRMFSVRLSDNTLFQWFTQINYFTKKKSISKSALERFSKLFDDSVIADVIRQWQSYFLSDADKTASIGLNNPFDFQDAFLDNTCVKANIHFPVD